MWKVVINMMGIKELLSEVAEEIDAAEHELIWQLQHGDSKSFAAARKDLRYWQSRVAGDFTSAAPDGFAGFAVNNL
jgi:hypothetical protein